MDMMERALSEFGTDSSIVSMIGSMLEERKVQLIKRDCAICVVITKECPQSSVLSSLVVNSLLECVGKTQSVEFLIHWLH